MLGKTLTENARSLNVKRKIFTFIKQNLGEYQKS